jgi:hypothetical protein
LAAVRQRGLRVKADDGQGNGIDQTVIRAYYLGEPAPFTAGR